MASGNTSKRVFPADIFAEDNDKWSWPLQSSNSKNPGSINYAALRKIAENESDSNSASDGESLVQSDSNSVKIIERSFRKRKSSSNSEGNPLEDASSSSGPSAPLPHERVLPSMYDDDARSASPSAYEKKDLAYVSSFRKEFNPSAVKNQDHSTFSPFENSNKADASKVPEKEATRRSSKDALSSPNRSSKSESRRSKSKSSRSRSKSRDKRPSRRSRSRSHSLDKRNRSPLKERRRSRSRERHSGKDRRHTSRSKRSRSRESRRSRSHSKDSRIKSRSRSRDSRRRSRSRGRDSRRSRSRSYDRRHHYRSSSRDRYHRKRYSPSRSRSRDHSKGRSGGAMTPQMALQQTMAAMSAKAQALTGVAFPKYYNPAAVNPLKYAEQVQKRKLLWQKDTVKVEVSTEQPKNTVWDKLQFAQDQDGKMTAKFRKLMGIKSEGAPPEEEKESVLKKQEELFRDLDQQYEMARVTTHTQRGVGLGYSAQALYPPVQK